MAFAEHPADRIRQAFSGRHISPVEKKMMESVLGEGRSGMPLWLDYESKANQSMQCLKADYHE